MSSLQVHRAIQHLKSLVKRYPNISRQVDEILHQRGKDLPEWPKWCFMPMAGWGAIASQCCVSNLYQPALKVTWCMWPDSLRVLPATKMASQLLYGLVLFSMIKDMQDLSAIGAWRYSQGIYRVDPDLLAALIDTPVSGSLPSDVLFRLPEWSLYVETPGLVWGADMLHGFWVHLEFDINCLRPELRLLLDLDEKLVSFPIPIGQWTLAEAVGRTLEQAAKYMPSFPRGDDVTQKMAMLFAPLVSIILYLCSQEPEIDNAGCPGRGPVRPAARKTKKGWRMFPADRPAYFDVGTHIGTKLRQARKAFAQDAAETGRTVRPHLRRGHWHGFWFGSRKGERVFKLKWLPPVLVANVEPAPPEKNAA